MAFREKIAWVSLAGIVAAFLPYFVLVATYAGPAPMAPLYSGTLFAAAAVGLALVVTVATILVAVVNRREAGAPADERDRGVARRASATAYAVLLPALFLAMATVFAGWSAAAIVNAVLGAVIVAELVRLGLEIAGYRRGGW